MKKYFIASISLLLSPLFAFAASDDVTLTTDVDIVIDGVTLDISGSSATIESITVNAANFTIDVQSGSTLKVSSADRRFMDASMTGAVIRSRTCTGDESTLTITTANASTVTISLAAGDCDNPSGSDDDSSPGSGGGGAPGTVSTAPIGTTVPAEPAEPTITPAVPATPEAAQPSPVAQLVSPVFNRALRPGMSHADVKRLQQLLNSDPDTQVAASGVGSSGNETEFFGSLTEKAVQKFQAKYGLVSSGTPDTTGYGLVGPKTRGKLAEVFFGGVTAEDNLSEISIPVAPSFVEVSPVFTRGLGKGMSHADVKRLQHLLNSYPGTEVAASGLGSLGNETDFFGSLTEKAVQKFQELFNVAKLGDPGYGYVGPKTRAKLQEVFGAGSSQSVPSAPATSNAAQEAALQAQIDALNAQLADMLKQLEGAQ